MGSGIGRETGDDGIRWYHDDRRRALSVTTVLKALEEDTTGLDYWKRQNDGTGDAPYHQHLFWVSGPRGTLAHYATLNPLADREMWGDEEQHSLTQLVEGVQDDELRAEWRSKGVPTDTTAIAYSVLRNNDTVESREQYELFFGDVALSDVVLRDVEWVRETFQTEVQPALGIDDDSVIGVEQYLLHDDGGCHPYGGQCDLLYENPDGETVLVDLKTSSSLRQKHVLQSVAYATAVEGADHIAIESVDRLAVVRCHPDSKTWQVHSHDVPTHASGVDNYTTDGWFEDEYGNWSYESRDDMWDTFARLTGRAYEQFGDGADED